MDDLPINQHVAFLNIFKEKKFPSLISYLRTESSLRSESQKDLELRKKSISSSRNQLKDASVDFNNLLDLAFHTMNIPSSNRLTNDAVTFINVHKSLNSQSTNSPYLKIKEDLHRFRQLIDILGILYTAPVEKLAKIFYLNCFYSLDDFQSTVPNWPSVYYSVVMATNISEWLRTESSKCQWFSNKELKRVTCKLGLVRNYLFNAQEYRFSDLRQQTRLIEPIQRFVPPREPFGLYSTPARQSIEAFRKTLVHFGYSIKEVNGDGNCFFRAVVKSVAPEVERSWEDHLSLQLRKRANPGNAQKCQESGQPESYPYKEFVIKNVNDSSVMSRPGVWADHIQIQKLSDLLHVCFQVIMYDDVGLHITHEGLLVPGPDYNIGQKYLLEQENSYQLKNTAPSPQKCSLFLYFNPNPGHYEALLPPLQPQGLTTGSNGQSLSQVICSLVEKPSYVKICQAYFLINREVEEVSRLFSIVKGVEEKKGELQQSLAVVKNAMRELSSSEFLELKGPAAIYQELLAGMEYDEICFSDAGVVTRLGEGPLSAMSTRIQKLGSGFSLPQYPKTNAQNTDLPSFLGGIIRGLF